MMTPCPKDITTHAWCIEHARPALGGAIPIGCAVAQQASKQASKQASSILFESNDSIPGEEACIMLSRRGFFCIPMCNNKTDKHMKNDYVTPVVETVEVEVEQGFQTSIGGGAFGGDDGVVITPPVG